MTLLKLGTRYINFDNVNVLTLQLGGESIDVLIQFANGQQFTVKGEEASLLRSECERAAVSHLRRDWPHDPAGTGTDIRSADAVNVAPVGRGEGSSS